MYFDTHAHYDSERYNEDRDELLSSMPNNGIELILNAACDLESSNDSIRLTEKYPFIFTSVGIHPHDAKSMTDNTITELEDLSKHPKVVAIGEIGLDFHYDFSPRDVQRKCFREQMKLAIKIKKPVIIHTRESTQETLSIISEYRDVIGVFHCFPGSWETAKILLNMGWYLSFTGVITFKNARKAIEVIEKMPLDRLMLETDCPYLAPEPNRGRRNSSLNMKYIVQKVADIRNMTHDEAAFITTENGKHLFGIK